MYVWSISPSCEIFLPVMPPQILPITTTSGIIKYNKWYQSRRFTPTWWWLAHTMEGVEEWLRTDGSHRPDGDRLIWWELSLEEEIVGYPSVSLSLTLNKNEKVKQYIRKKTYKPIALRFWVKSGVIPLYVGPISPSCDIPIPIKHMWVLWWSWIEFFKIQSRLIHIK